MKDLEEEGISRISGDIGENKKTWSEIASKITTKKLEKTNMESIMCLLYTSSAVCR